MTDPLHVAVGVIQDATGRVLTALRPDHLHQGGLWEFPGGKVEPGEDVLQALQRELHEELGITVHLSQCYPLCRIRYQYPGKAVLLDVWRVDAFSGEPGGREGQEIRWQTAASLRPDDFPAANRSIINVLNLPDFIAISAPTAGMEGVEKWLDSLATSRIQLAQLRLSGVDEKAFLSLARHATDYCQRLGIALQVNASEAVFEQLDCAGLHVNAHRLMALASRPVPDARFFSASCHNLAELQHADALGADFVFLSPVKATATHPETTGMGWTRFQQLARQVGIPVYALGGLGPADLGIARQSGARGIAAISAFQSGNATLPTG